jgi:glycosyltransferase involved in cell wall biosynthesis
MKVALYYPWIYVKGGIEREILELVTHSRHEWVIYTSHYEPENTFAGFRDLNVVELRRVSVKRAIGSVLIAALAILRQKLPLEGFDCLVVKCDGLGNLITFRNASLPAFCLCSTPLRPVYDEVYEKSALADRGFLGRAIYRAFQALFRPVDRRAWRNYAGVIAVSAEVKRRILKHRLFPEGQRLQIHHPGIDMDDAPTSVSYEPMLLVPGRIMWTKGIGLAIEAFRLAQLPEPWRLVVAGFVDRKSGTYLAGLEKQATGLRVEFLTSPSDEDLHGLYCRAAAVLFPPANEDWGIVPLEAMLRSKAVMANAKGGPTESIVHGETGWLLEQAPEAWAAVLGTFPDRLDLLESMGRKGKERVDRYDWEHFVTGVDNMVESGREHPMPETTRP